MEQEFTKKDKVSSKNLKNKMQESVGNENNKWIKISRIYIVGAVTIFSPELLE